MKILIAGASGLLGTAIINGLKPDGHIIYRLVRHLDQLDTIENAILWNLNLLHDQQDFQPLENFDVFINLAGENISAFRWTKEKKERIYDSRIHSTQWLTQACLELKNPPKIFINASAVGIYGNHGDEIVDEDSTFASDGFLETVCRDWEQALSPLKNTDIRAISTRFGVVLSKHGGALNKMLTPFKLGLGGVLGSGQQYMSWIDIDDVVNIIKFIINKKNIKGPINVVSPNPVTNLEFTKTLGSFLNKPTFLTIPEWAIKLIFGEMGEALFLSSVKAIPSRLQQNGYIFLYPTLKESFQHLILK